ncbi:hypothetical protein BT93_G2209 [Corymbia citriodora subsp. variegata]|nr:hypothetical protein BT93_G2209 [Corymbia citriodora subsp. variegata]
MQLEGFSFAKLRFRDFIFAIAIALCFVQVSSASNETDKFALLAFKAGITEDPLGVLSSWNNTVNLCQWFGITCSRRHHNRVTALDLYNQKLSGFISPHIGNLSFLRRLWLSNNSFHHEIPPQIGWLRRLRILALYQNFLAGVGVLGGVGIPKNTSGCINLRAVDLCKNQLSGEVPPEIGSLAKLWGLCLGRKNLTGSFPSFVGSLPRALGQLTNLTTLNLVGNLLSGTVPHSLYNLSSLVVFDIGFNQIHGSLPTTMGFGLSNLEFFSIAENKFVGSIPPWIANNATNLQVLQLGSNKLSGEVPSFESLRDLRKLRIAINYLGRGGSGDLNFLCSLTNSTTLTQLSTVDNKLGGLLAGCIGNFSITITILELGLNPIIGEIPKGIGNLVNLEILSMANTSISGAIPFEVGNLQNLAVLYLSNNNLSGLIPSSLQKKEKLIYSYLSGNHFHGPIPLHLDNCQNLMELDLSDNNLNGSIFPIVKTLLSMDLSYNHLSGSLPMEVGKMDHLDYLDISRNMFGGEIPSTLGDCVGLTVLRMSNNHFQGSIPQSFRSLRSIEGLDLSKNNLSGKIPKFLEASRSLEFLNLSYNNFEGVLPTGGIFKNASATFIAGNNKICGGISEFQLPKCISRHSKSKGVVHNLKLLLFIIFGLLGMVLVLIFVSVCWLKIKKAQEPTSSSIASSWQNLSYGSLHRATEGFSSTNLIGVGSFGPVYRGTLQENGTNVAAKVLYLMHHGALKSFKVECKALKCIKHQNLLKVLTQHECDGDIEGYEWLCPKRQGGAGEKRVSAEWFPAKISRNSGRHIKALVYEFMPNNVLLDAEMVEHVGDFGSAKIVLEATSYANTIISSIDLKGAIGYVAPTPSNEEFLHHKIVDTSFHRTLNLIMRLCTCYFLIAQPFVDLDKCRIWNGMWEMFTGISPAVEIFKENSNLHNFVEEALPKQVLEITDPILAQEVESDVGLRRKSTVQDRLLMVYRIGIACSVGVPRERMSIADAAAQLRSIRDKLCTSNRPKLDSNPIKAQKKVKLSHQNLRHLCQEKGQAFTPKPSFLMRRKRSSFHTKPSSLPISFTSCFASVCACSRHLISTICPGPETLDFLDGKRNNRS